MAPPLLSCAVKVPWFSHAIAIVIAFVSGARLALLAVARVAVNVDDAAHC